MSYPVFRFDLSAENFNSQQRLINYISGYLDNIGREYSLESEGSIARRFSDLIQQACKLYGRKVVILIDEYDKPILDCLLDETLHEELKAELRGFYAVIKANDQYIKFALLTGVTKFGQMSIFSGLNNLNDVSLRPEFNAVCGITESEIHHYFTGSVENFAQR